jgi:hypothetical protein
MKLWRKAGYRNLSGRIYGANREKVYLAYPSALLLALVSRVTS